MKIRTIGGLASIVGAILISSISSFAEEVAAPVTPELLLQSLPKPEGWKITASNGKHLRLNPPKSKGVREYLQVLPLRDPSLSSQSVVRTPTRVRITVVDSCGDPSIVDLYSPSTADQDGSGMFFRIGESIAVRHPVEGVGDRIEVLLANRFLVTLEQWGDPTPTLEKWVGLIDAAGLEKSARSSGKIDITYSYRFVLKRIDELNPKRNGSSPSEFSGIIQDEISGG